MNIKLQGTPVMHTKLQETPLMTKLKETPGMNAKFSNETKLQETPVI